MISHLFVAKYRWSQHHHYHSKKGYIAKSATSITSEPKNLVKEVISDMSPLKSSQLISVKVKTYDLLRRSFIPLPILKKGTASLQHAPLHLCGGCDPYVLHGDGRKRHQSRAAQHGHHFQRTICNRLKNSANKTFNITVIQESGFEQQVVLSIQISSL